jgi:ATP-binding cassette subfamily C protein
MTEEVEKAGYAARSLMTLATGVIVTTVYGLLAFSLSPVMTSFSLVSGGVVMVLLTRWRRAGARTGEEQSAVNKLLYSALGESLANMKTIRVHGAEARHAHELAAIASRERQLVVRVAGSYGVSKLWFDVAAVGLMSAVTFVAIRRLALSPAELLVLLFVFMRLAPQLGSLHHVYQNLVVELPGFGSVLEAEARCRSAAQPDDPSAEPVPFEREVRVDRVTYGYDERMVLSDVTIAIPAGRTVAIVGPSGAGKTTVADLTLGLLTPHVGAVLVDGKPLTAARLAAWRSQIGYVPQETFLFHETIRSNLLWAAPQASDDELWSALRSSAAAFVADLPAGLDTVVGDRGVRLSGGERQRLALARALLRRPRLLILDEATSSLDSENERVIEQAITNLHGHVAILLITHRLSTVRHADTIYVLDHGRIAECGRWDDLLARPQGRFQLLCRAQGIEPETGVVV